MKIWLKIQTVLSWTVALTWCTGKCSFLQGYHVYCVSQMGRHQCLVHHELHTIPSERTSLPVCLSRSCPPSAQWLVSPASLRSTTSLPLRRCRPTRYNCTRSRTLLAHLICQVTWFIEAWIRFTFKCICIMVVVWHSVVISLHRRRFWARSTASSNVKL